MDDIVAASERGDWHTVIQWVEEHLKRPALSEGDRYLLTCYAALAYYNTESLSLAETGYLEAIQHAPSEPLARELLLRLYSTAERYHEWVIAATGLLDVYLDLQEMDHFLSLFRDACEICVARGLTHERVGIFLQCLEKREAVTSLLGDVMYTCPTLHDLFEDPVYVLITLVSDAHSKDINTIENTLDEQSVYQRNNHDKGDIFMAVKADVFRTSSVGRLLRFLLHHYPDHIDAPGWRNHLFLWLYTKLQVLPSNLAMDGVWAGQAQFEDDGWVLSTRGSLSSRGSLSTPKSAPGSRGTLHGSTPTARPPSSNPALFSTVGAPATDVSDASAYVVSAGPLPTAASIRALPMGAPASPGTPPPRTSGHASLVSLASMSSFSSRSSVGTFPMTIDFREEEEKRLLVNELGSLSLDIIQKDSSINILPWMFHIEHFNKSRRCVFRAENMYIMRRFAAIFPESPLSGILRHHYAWAEHFLYYKDKNNRPPRPCREEYEQHLEKILQSTHRDKCVFTYSLCARYFCSAKDEAGYLIDPCLGYYTIALESAEAGLRHLENIEYQSGKINYYARATFLGFKATAYTYLHPPRYHSEAEVILDELLPHARMDVARSPRSAAVRFHLAHLLTAKVHILTYAQDWVQSHPLLLEVIALRREGQDLLSRLDPNSESDREEIIHARIESLLLVYSESRICEESIWAEFNIACEDLEKAILDSQSSSKAGQKKSTSGGMAAQHVPESVAKEDQKMPVNTEKEGPKMSEKTGRGGSAPEIVGHYDSASAPPDGGAKLAPSSDTTSAGSIVLSPNGNVAEGLARADSNPKPAIALEDGLHLPQHAKTSNAPSTSHVPYNNITHGTFTLQMDSVPRNQGTTPGSGAAEEILDLPETDFTSPSPHSEAMHEGGVSSPASNDPHQSLSISAGSWETQPSSSVSIQSENPKETSSASLPPQRKGKSLARASFDPIPMRKATAKSSATPYLDSSDFPSQHIPSGPHLTGVFPSDAYSPRHLPGVRRGDFSSSSAFGGRIFHAPIPDSPINEEKLADPPLPGDIPPHGEVTPEQFELLHKIINLKALLHRSIADARADFTLNARVADHNTHDVDSPCRRRLAQAWYRLGECYMVLARHRITYGLTEEDAALVRRESDVTYVALALRAYLNSLAVLPDFAATFTALGVYYLTAAAPGPDEVRAKICLYKAHNLDKGQFLAARMLCEILARAEEWLEVERICNVMVASTATLVDRRMSVTTLVKKMSWIWAGLGNVYVHRGDHARALWAYDFVLRAYPQDVSIWIRRAYSQNRLGQYQPALKLLDKAIATSGMAGPDLFAYYSLKSHILVRMGRPAEGIAEYSALYAKTTAVAPPQMQGTPEQVRIGTRLQATQKSMELHLAHFHCGLGMQMLAACDFVYAEEELHKALNLAVVLTETSFETYRSVWKLLHTTLGALARIPEPVFERSAASLQLFRILSQERVDARVDVGVVTVAGLLAADPQNVAHWYVGLAVLVAKMSLAKEYAYESGRGPALMDLGLALRAAADAAAALGLVSSRRVVTLAAARCVAAAVRCDPGRAVYWNCLGVLGVELGRPRLAQHAFVTALEQPFGTTYGTFWTNLGVLYLAYGHDALASQCLQRSQGVGVENAATWTAFAVLALRARDWKTVKTMARHASMQMRPLSEADMLHALASWVLYRQALPTIEGSPYVTSNAYSVWARVHHDAHDQAALTGALFSAKRYLNRFPRDVTGLNLCGLLLERTGDLEGAYERFSQAAAVLADMLQGEGDVDERNGHDQGGAKRDATLQKDHDPDENKLNTTHHTPTPSNGASPGTAPDTAGHGPGPGAGKRMQSDPDLSLSPRAISAFESDYDEPRDAGLGDHVVETQYIYALTNLARVLIKLKHFEAGAQTYEYVFSCVEELIADVRSEARCARMTTLTASTEIINPENAVRVLAQALLGSAIAHYSLGNTGKAEEVLEYGLEVLHAQHIDDKFCTDALSLALVRLHWSQDDEERALASLLDSTDIFISNYSLLRKLTGTALAVLTKDQNLLKLISSLTATDHAYRYHPDASELFLSQRLLKQDYEGALQILTRTMHASPWSIESSSAVMILLLYRVPDRRKNAPLPWANLTLLGRLLKSSDLFDNRHLSADTKSMISLWMALGTLNRSGGEIESLAHMQKAYFIKPWDAYQRLAAVRLNAKIRAESQ